MQLIATHFNYCIMYSIYFCRCASTTSQCPSSKNYRTGLRSSRESATSAALHRYFTMSSISFLSSNNGEHSYSYQHFCKSLSMASLSEKVRCSRKIFLVIRSEEEYFVSIRDILGVSIIYMYIYLKFPTYCLVCRYEYILITARSIIFLKHIYHIQPISHEVFLAGFIIDILNHFCLTATRVTSESKFHF